MLATLLPGTCRRCARIEFCSAGTASSGAVLAGSVVDIAGALGAAAIETDESALGAGGAIAGGGFWSAIAFGKAVAGGVGACIEIIAGACVALDLLSTFDVCDPMSEPSTVTLVVAPIAAAIKAMRSVRPKRALGAG